MNVEVYSYSVLASILGVSIVFLSLIMLSLLMVALKAVFHERAKPEVSVQMVSVSPGGPAATSVKRESTDWVMAAVAAFLAGEEITGPSAKAWIPGSFEKSDPWMNRAAFDKKIG